MVRQPLPCLVIFLGLALAALPSHAASRAATVVYAFGEVTAQSSSGATRALSRGDRIGPGDAVRTGRGRTQLRFTDGGYAALQPGTEYKVEEYHYEGKADGNERSFLNLVRGSVRLVTGLIGRTNKQNFRLNTPVATIGIRGTSGKVSHCDGNCGERGPGTSLAGYGGVWDLNSGSYSGPVEPGQATFCNGSSCFDIPGFGQRQEVDPNAPSDLEENAEENAESTGTGGNEPLFTDGNQSDDAGRQCAFGNCDDPANINVLTITGLIGAEANQLTGGGDISPTRGDTSDIADASVVFNNGAPVAVVAVQDESDIDEVDDFPINFVTVDPAALRQAVADFPDSTVSNTGLNILDALPASQLETLLSNPASVASEDFGRTSDGHLLFWRWIDGYVLSAGASPDSSEVVSELELLTGFQSEHFIFGSQPTFIPSTGLATYQFTGGTFSTAVDGSSIGVGVTDGMIALDFLALTGALDMVVEHGDMIFDVLGALRIESDDPRFFFDQFELVKAFHRGTENYYQVTVDGFLAEDGAQAPLAAGIAYEIVTPVAIVGVAGFGLQTVVDSPPLLTVDTLGPFSSVQASAANNIFVQQFGLGYEHSWFATGAHAVGDSSGTKVAGIGAHDSLLPGQFNPITNSVDAVRASLASLNGFTRTDEANQILDLIPAADIATLESNPAQLAENAFDSASGLYYSRWTGGNTLQILGNLSNPAGSVFEVSVLSGFQSVHIIGGLNPVAPPSSGLAEFLFTSGTDSTAVDGSSIGSGVLSGGIVFDFGLGLGAIEMLIAHDSQTYEVDGPLFASTFNEFFSSTPMGLTAVSGSNNVYPASAIGVFDSATNNLLAAGSGAGVSYIVNTLSPFQGVAAFAGTGTASPQPLDPGDYVAFSHSFNEMYGLNGRVWDFNEDGMTNTALRTAGVVTQFTTDDHLSPCMPACTFTAGGVATRDPTGPGGTTNNGEYGVNWARFAPSNTIAHSQMGTEQGSSHVITAEELTQMANIPTMGVATYNVIKGGSLPTIQFETNGILNPEVVGTLDTASIAIDFGTGNITSNFAGTFPDGGAGGSWTVIGGGASFNPADQNHNYTGTGTVTSANLSDPMAYMTDCSGGCTVYYETVFDLVGPNAEAAAGAIQLNTSPSSYPEFAANATFLLGQ